MQASMGSTLSNQNIELSVNYKNSVIGSQLFVS